MVSSILDEIISVFGSIHCLILYFFAVWYGTFTLVMGQLCALSLIKHDIIMSVLLIPDD